MPAGSEPDIEATTFHVPSDSTGRSHEDTDGDFVYVHDLVLDPFVAVMVTSEPSGTPRADTVGVESLVRSSVELTPESLAATRSTPVGPDGGVVSMEMGRLGDNGDALPAGSTDRADTSHTPSPSVGRSQPPVVAVATNEHDRVTPPEVAVMVTVSPATRPVRFIDGVESFVRLSLVFVPVSLEVARSRPPGAFGAVVSI